MHTGLATGLYLKKINDQFLAFDIKKATSSDTGGKIHRIRVSDEDQTTVVPCFTHLSLQRSTDVRLMVD